MHEWIEAERRGAVALVLARTRRPLRDSRGRVLQLLAELEGAWVEPPLDRERRIRLLAEEIEKIPEIVEAEALPRVQSTGNTTIGHWAATCHIRATRSEGLARSL